MYLSTTYEVAGKRTIETLGVARGRGHPGQEHWQEKRQQQGIP